MKPLSSKKRLDIVQRVLKCVANLPDRERLSASRIADSVIEACGDDPEKIESAFASFEESSKRNTRAANAVLEILKKRRSRGM